MKVYYIDLFCGAGGTTTGVHLSEKGEVIACVNHDETAIQSHKANHPKCKHFIEDIRTLDIRPLIEMVNQIRAREECIIALWASLECTNFSKAKGGLPKNADSRTLAEDLKRYIAYLHPDTVWIENVIEFMDWGPLDKDSRPIKEKKGEDYNRWVSEIESMGYEHSWRKLCAADYGAFTIRSRYFAQFNRPYIRTSWPKPTHSKDGVGLEKWKPVREVLDLCDEGKSIFNRKRKIVDNTFKRIYAGLKKFVKKPFYQLNYSGNPDSKVYPLDVPAATITTIDHHSLVQPFIQNYYSGSDEHRCKSLDDPCNTVTTSNRQALVTPENFFLQTYYGNGGVYCGDDSSPSVTTKDRISKVQFFTNHFSGGGQLTNIDNPSPTVTTVPKSNLTTANRWLMDHQYNNKGRSIDSPCQTVIARQDKKPIYSIFCEAGNFKIPIYEDDSEIVVKVKTFMAEHGISDIKMRMLNVKELLRIQGFPEDYILFGNQSEQKKFIGNAVEVNVAKALTSHYYDTVTSELNYANVG